MARVLLGITGSVAAIKAPELYAGLLAAGHEVKVAATEASRCFFDEERLVDLSAPVSEGALFVRGQSAVYHDADEWPRDRRFQVGEPVLHIELRRWAQALLIAPLDANTLAKLSLGLCDNLLTCIYRAWDPQRPVLLAPAMNTHMWDHPATIRHLAQLAEDFGCSGPIPHPDAEAACDAINATTASLRIVKPVSKRLACGDVGMGGMATVPEIVAAVTAMSAA